MSADLRGAEPEANTAPWNGRQVEWRIDGETFTANYHPGELKIMEIARERGATRVELEAVHLLKALLDAVIVDAEATA